MALEDARGVAGHRLGFRWIERGDDGIAQAVFIEGADAAVRRDEVIRERLEVFHVRAEDHGFPRNDRLTGLLSAGGVEAFSDDHHIRVRRPIAQLAGGIDEENVAALTVRRRRLKA